MVRVHYVQTSPSLLGNQGPEMVSNLTNITQQVKSWSWHQTGQPQVWAHVQDTFGHGFQTRGGCPANFRIILGKKKLSTMENFKDKQCREKNTMKPCVPITQAQ